MSDLKAVRAILEELQEHEGDDYCTTCACYVTSRHVEGPPGQSGYRCFECDSFVVNDHIRRRKLIAAAYALVT